MQSDKGNVSESKNRLKTKQELFESDPNRFIDREDLILAAVKQRGPNGEDGVGYSIQGALPNHVFISSLYYLQKMVDEIVYAKKAAAQQAKKSGLIVPGASGDNGKSRISDL